MAGVDPLLADALTELADRAMDLAAARAACAAAVATDRARVGRLALDLLHHDPVLRGHLGATAPGSPRTSPPGGRRRTLARQTAAQVHRLRLAGGRPGRRQDHPRDWLGQLAAVPVFPHPHSAPPRPVIPSSCRPPGPGPAPPAAWRTSTCCGNGSGRRTGRRRPRQPPRPDALHCPMPTGVLRCAVVDTGSRAPGCAGSNCAAHRSWTRSWRSSRPAPPVRRGRGPDRGAPEHPANGTPEGRRRAVTALRGFLQHLLRLGVLQLCAAPAQRRTHWTPAARIHPPHHALDGHPAPATCSGPGRSRRHRPARHRRRAAPPGRHVVRRLLPHLDAGLDALALARITRGLRLATRLAALRAEDRPPTNPTGTTAQPYPGPVDIGPEPRSVAELLTAPPADPSAEPDRPTTATTRRRYRLAPARTPGSDTPTCSPTSRPTSTTRGSTSTARCWTPATPARGPELLAAWPADCLLRPLDAEGRSPSWRRSPRPACSTPGSPRPCTPCTPVRAATPTGRLPGLPRRPRTGRGRPLRRGAGPPLDARAANAVRRPVLTDWCTGDANMALYYGSYSDGEACGRRPRRRPAAGRKAPRPVHHLPSTGSPSAPTAASSSPRSTGRGSSRPPRHPEPRPALRPAHPPADGGRPPATQHVVQLGGLIRAFPTAGRVPRLSVGGDLVVSPPRGGCPSRNCGARAREADKVTSLAVLRRTRQLPRFCFARPAPGAKPVPVDLAALPTLHVLERLRAAAPDRALIVEALPHLAARRCATPCTVGHPSPPRCSCGCRTTPTPRSWRPVPPRPCGTGPHRPRLDRGPRPPRTPLQRDGPRGGTAHREKEGSHAHNHRTDRPRQPHRRSGRPDHRVRTAQRRGVHRRLLRRLHGHRLRHGALLFRGRLLTGGSTRRG
ncbi:hypothetical protein O1L55_10395 [Streptomyces albulus]|nr:hypothetical protein [Streptomyces noursei]